MKKWTVTNEAGEETVVEADRCATGDGGDLTFWNLEPGSTSPVTARAFAAGQWVSCWLVKEG